MEYSFKEYWQTVERKPRNVEYVEEVFKSPECVDYKYIRRLRKIVRDYRDILNQNATGLKWKMGSERLYRGPGTYVYTFELVKREGRDIKERIVLDFVVPPVIPKK